MNILDEIDFFVEQNRLYTLIIGSIFTQFLTELFSSFTNDILMPLLNRDFNNNKQGDINELKRKKVNIYGFTFNYGSFLVAVFRFVIVLFILLVINRLRFNKKRK